MDYHVVPRVQGWAVRRRGATRASKRFAKRSDAIRYGRRLAAGGVLYVHRRDGTVERMVTTLVRALTGGEESCRP